MTVSELISKIFAFVIAGILLIISIRSFKNRGFLLNNAYLYAQKEERDKMDKELKAQSKPAVIRSGFWTQM